MQRGMALSTPPLPNDWNSSFRSRSPQALPKATPPSQGVTVAYTSPASWLDLRPPPQGKVKGTTASQRHNSKAAPPPAPLSHRKVATSAIKCVFRHTLCSSYLNAHRQISSLRHLTPRIKAVHSEKGRV